GGHLAAHELAALAGLRTLGHLDRELVGVDEVFGVHAEPAAGDLPDAAAEAALLDLAAEAVDRGVLFALGPDLLPERPPRPLGDVVTPPGLAALAAVGERVEFVDRRGDGHVRGARERAVAHRGAAEVLPDDVNRRLHPFAARGVTCLPDQEQVAQHRRHAGVHHLGELHELVGDAPVGAGVV